MASSGTDAHWAESGLGQGPRRRRWAWVDEEQDADENDTWAEDRPLPGASSPELLEDFRLAQQRLQPQGWGPDPPAGDQSEESVEEEFEAEEEDSPESSSLPLNWLPQSLCPDVTEVEPDEALGVPEVEETEESSPQLDCKTSLNVGTKDTSPVALEWDHPLDRLASDKQTGGDKLQECSEVNPTVDLSSARSWGSGTMSLDSTWEEENHGPQSTAPAEALSPSPSQQILNLDNRTRGNVALTTPTEFQDSSTLEAQSLQSPKDRWRREVTNRLSFPQPRGQAWRQNQTSPKLLPSRFTVSLSTPSPSPRPVRKDTLPAREVTTVTGHSSSDTAKYGQGRLNHPLPDLSKVGPRVRFPKNESYHPPKSRSHSKLPQDSARPLIFKSPAEIVREVLLSSGEGCLGKEMPSTHPITRVPQEFQTPEQATKLVHQLQEDYHKLLTKYAEAENTIDQLRLGAKVNLYSDPPQANHSIHMGTMPQATKVLSFTVAQPHSVQRWPSSAEAPQVSEASGWASVEGNPRPSSSSSMPSPKRLPEHENIARGQPWEEQTQMLAARASWFLAKVKSFADLMQAGQLMPQDQLKGFQWLKAAHEGLEEEYLKACREQHLNQRAAGSSKTSGRFDPSRELEAEIFQLGIRLDELKDLMDQNQQVPEQAGSDPPLDSPPVTPSPHQPIQLAAPSGQTPVPATQILGPKPDATSTGPCQPHAHLELSTASSKTEDRPLDLPTPLRNKERQMEQDFHGLLEQYLSVKSLPEALRMEEEEGLVVATEKEEEEEQNQACILEVDGLSPAPGKAEPTTLPLVQAERSHKAPPEEPMEQRGTEQPADFLASSTRDGHLPGLGMARKDPPGPGRPPLSRGAKSAGSHESSLTSLEGSGVSEHLTQKSLCQSSGLHLEESWMVSPETDSGFVGSETSRVSPFTQTPEHRLSHISVPETSAQLFSASLPRDGASHLQIQGPRVPRRAPGPSLPRNQLHRHLSSQNSALKQRAPSYSLERVLAAKRAPGSECKGKTQLSEQLPPSTTIASPPTPAPEVLPHGRTETNTAFLLTRMGRDQAIHELQEEVSRLRLQLEDSVHRSPQCSPMHPTSTHITRVQDQPPDSSAAWGAHYGSKSTERLSCEPGGTEQAVPAVRRRARSSSVPREVPRLSLSSESEPASPRLFSEKSKSAEDHVQATQDGARGVGSTRRQDRVTFRGQYTGQEYHVLTPRDVPRGSRTVSCPHCQPGQTQDAGGTVSRDPLGLSLTALRRCPVCSQAGSSAEGHGPDSVPSGPEKAATRRNAPSTSSSKQRSQQAGSPQRPPPGLWYLAATPPAPVPPAFAYVSSVPVLPYPSATVYYAPLGTTSASAAQPAANQPSTASSQPTQGHQHSIQLDLEDLEELNKALSRAVQAAQSIRSTTKQMSRSLSADLRQARSLRGSCLF
ncbi:microtubule organization protein AKNA isoform X2 [Erinaceus europaeus]|uniref:Microtubule organization protein AKNA isoform X2 n=1 Tax=Erinaceus europaeus TaxID=9365 RepID=A0ABM3Y4M2_ERIEU|nr:microtubule organization protein AKNA isoform X2 [Erinaceus europaeus]